MASLCFRHTTIQNNAIRKKHAVFTLGLFTAGPLRAAFVCLYLIGMVGWPPAGPIKQIQ